MRAPSPNHAAAANNGPVSSKNIGQNQADFIQRPKQVGQDILNIIDDEVEGN